MKYKVGDYLFWNKDIVLSRSGELDNDPEFGEVIKIGNKIQLPDGIFFTDIYVRRFMSSEKDKDIQPNSSTHLDRVTYICHDYMLKKEFDNE